MTLDELAWPLARLHEGIESLARAFGRPATTLPRAPVDTQLESVLQRWMDQAASLTELEAEAVDVTLKGVVEFFKNVRGAIVQIGGGFQPTYLIVLRGGRRTVQLLVPDEPAVRVRTSQLARWVERNRLDNLRAQVGNALPKVPLSERRQALFHERLLRITGADAPIGAAWLLRPPPGERFVDQMRSAELFRGLGIVFLLSFVQSGLTASSWLIFGSESLRGHLDRGRMAAWALLLLVAVPLQVGNNWLLGELALRASAPFKRRLVDGALRISPDVIRHDGVGALLSRVNESVVLEGLLVTGGLNAMAAIGEWVLAGLLLSQSAFPGVALAAFFVFTAGVLFLGLRYHERFEAWTRARLRMSTGLVERLVGHRTRIGQERRDRWHNTEDQLLHGYAVVSRRMDGMNTSLASFPRALPILGVVVVAPLILGQSNGPSALVLALIGVASAAASIDALGSVLALVARGRVAWRSVGPLFDASKPDPKTVTVQQFSNMMTQTRTGGDEVLLEARDVFFRYGDRPRPVLERCSVTIRRGDRVLLEGSSGGGKSTLAALFAGLRSPESGLLLIRGLDRHTLSPQQWRAAVAIAPQFHENHVFANSLAFNLLLGRRWPATDQELAEARAVCEELGLGPLLQRMPAGLFENVGETGWQLSHGEKSRVYIARAILQRSDVMIFDESFAALDPDTMEQVLRCVMKRAPTLLAIAHP